MTPRVFKHESLPTGPTWDVVQDILAATAGDRPAAIRDHATMGLQRIRHGAFPLLGNFYD
jgi:hypothetical protein